MPSSICRRMAVPRKAAAGAEAAVVAKRAAADGHGAIDIGTGEVPASMLTFCTRPPNCCRRKWLYRVIAMPRRRATGNRSAPKGVRSCQFLAWENAGRNLCDRSDLGRFWLTRKRAGRKLQISRGTSLRS